MKNLKLVTLTAAVLAAHGAFAGEKAGNGGIALVCRDSNEQVISAQMLDVLEATGDTPIGYGLPLISSAQKSVDDIINEAAGKTDPEQPIRYPRYHNAIIDQIKDIFSEENSRMEPLDQIVIETNDYGKKHVAVVRKAAGSSRCGWEQVGNYAADGKLYVSQEIYAKMDNLNIAAFKLHEAIYKMGRHAGETTSETSRYMVGYLLSSRPVSIVSDREIIKLFAKFSESIKHDQIPLTAAEIEMQRLELAAAAAVRRTEYSNVYGHGAICLSTGLLSPVDRTEVIVTMAATDSACFDRPGENWAVDRLKWDEKNGITPDKSGSGLDYWLTSDGETLLVYKNGALCDEYKKDSSVVVLPAKTERPKNKHRF